MRWKKVYLKRKANSWPPPSHAMRLALAAQANATNTAAEQQDRPQ